MNVSVYFVSKPLQYFNASNIEDSEPKVCLFVDNFSGALEIYQKIEKESKHWSKVLFFAKVEDAYKWMFQNLDIINKIFIDSDYGFVKNTWLFKLRKKEIFVFEEGVGSYTNNRRDNSFIQMVIKFSLKLIGIQDHIGGSIFTKGIILYDHEKHRLIYPNYKKLRIRFKKPFLTHLHEFEETDLFVTEQLKIVVNKLYNKDVVLYLTSWVYNNKVDKYLELYGNYIKILKPHPHMTETFFGLQGKYDYIIKNNVMIEFLLIRLVNVVNKLIIIHENSTAVIYIKDNKVLQSIDLNRILENN